MPEQIIEADLTFTGEQFEAGVQVSVGADGRSTVGRSPITANAITPTTTVVHQPQRPGCNAAHNRPITSGRSGQGVEVSSRHT